MALQKQKYFIKLAGGVDTKSDPKQIHSGAENSQDTRPVLPGKLLTLENGVFKTSNSITKRNGYLNITQNILGGLSITRGVGVASFENQLTMYDGAKFYSYSPSLPAWSLKGPLPSCNLASTPIIKNSYNQTSQDSAYSSIGMSVHAWEDSSGGVRYSVVDQTSGQHIVNNALISATATLPRVASINNLFVVFYVDSNQIKFRSMSIATPQTLGPVSPVTSNLHPTKQIFDVTINSTGAFVGYTNNTAGITLYYFDSFLNQSSAHTVGTDQALFGLTLTSDSSNNVWVTYMNGLYPKVFVCSYSTFFTDLLSPTVIETLPVGCSNVTCSVIGTKGYFFYEIPATNTYNYYVRTNTVTLAGVVGTASTLVRSVGLASKSFVYNGNVYVLVAYSSNLQGKYFLVNQSGQVACRISGEPQLGGGVTAKTILPSVSQLTSDTFQISYLQVDSVSFNTSNTANVISTTTITQTGVVQGQIAFSTGTVFNTSELGKNLNLTGGIPSIYDSNSIVEQGFNLYPENLTYVYSPTGGNLKVGSYQYIATYEWTDTQGQTHRSSASIPLTVPPFSLTATGTYAAAATSITALSAPDQVYAGMSVTGLGIPANTRITSVTTTTTINLSSTTTAGTGAGQTINLIPGRQYSAHYTAGSTTSVFAPNQFINFSANATSGSRILNVLTPQPFSVGMTITDTYGCVGASNTITAINGNQITLANAVTSTRKNSVFSYGIQISCTTVNGSTTVTAVSATDLGMLQIGMAFGASNAIASLIPQIDSIGTNSFTTSQPQAASASGVRTVYFPGTTGVYAGQTFTTATNAYTISSVQDNYTVIIGTPAAATTGGGSDFENIYTSDTVGIQLTVPTLRVTNKNSTTTPANVVIYRTQNNGTIFNQITSATAPIFNDPTTDSVTYYDLASDRSILTNKTLYTTGGVVDNSPCPPSNITAVFDSRQIIIPSENPRTWWYSKQVIPGSPVEFSDFFINNIDPRGGDITALGVMDDKLLFFKRNVILVGAGSGPAANGTSPDVNFVNPQLITTDTGCVEPKSIVATPGGLMFKSPKGIYIIDRSLAAKYIGADVEAYNSATVTSTQLIPSQNQVRFTLNTGVALVYDYYFGQWSVFTNHSAVDSCIYNKQFTYLQPSGLVLTETPGLFTDSGNFIKLKITTGWLSFAGLQGFQRVYKALVLGDYRSPHQLHVTMAYDFNPNPVQENYINAGTLLAQDTYGGDAYYGADKFYGSPTGFPLYQWRLDLARQKCESLQISLEDVQSATPGEGCSFSALGFEVGLKAGLNKVPGSGSFG